MYCLTWECATDQGPRLSITQERHLFDTIFGMMPRALEPAEMGFRWNKLVWKVNKKEKPA